MRRARDDEAVPADDLLRFGIPDEQLLVALFRRVLCIDVDRCAGAAACVAERQFAQASQFLHDVRAVAGRDDVDFVASVVGLAQ